MQKGTQLWAKYVDLMKVVTTALSLSGLKGQVFPVTNILHQGKKGAYALLESQPIFCFLNYSFFKEGIKYNSKARDSASSFTHEGTNDLGESLRAELALVPASDS